MKFYNPFRPHIVKIGSFYAVRRWRFGWECKSRTYNIWEDDNGWWMQYCYTTIENCREMIYRKPTKTKMEVIE